MYNNLDETSEDYPEKLQEFFKAYNDLGPVKRKLVDTITGVLSAKDKLLNNLKHIVLVDLYSEQKLDTTLEGKVAFQSENDSVATVSADGNLKTVSVGIAKIEAASDNGDTEVFRVFVKKPILATTVNVKKGGSVNVSLPSDTVVTEVKVSSTKKVSVSRSNLTLSVTGNAKGTAYVYVGTKSGKTLKYKIKVK
jgi:hypothetical protein